jgi:hypothetical protein
MQDPTEVVTHATHGIVKELAAEMEVSLPRMYEILSRDNPIPKAKRLIRKIARINQAGGRLIKADFDAMWLDILGDDAEVTAADLHKEAFEAVQACLENKSPADRSQELRELISVAELMLEGIEKSKELKAVQR